MRLSRIEFWAMNTPARRFIQKHLEFRIFKEHLKRHGIELTGKVILNAGCGSGYDTELIIKEFMPSQIIAFDFMPEQIALAKKRGLNAIFFVGDITKIESPPNTFDVVFTFGVLHHVPQWRIALKEIARVLKPGGVLLIEEPGQAMLDFFLPVGFIHPKEAKFEWPEFLDNAKAAGFKILEERKMLFGGFRSFLCLKEAANST